MRSCSLNIFCLLPLLCATLLPALGQAADLLLYAPASTDTGFEERVPKLLRSLPTPAEDGFAPLDSPVVEPISALALPTAAPLWVAGGADSRYCSGATSEQSKLEQLVRDGISYMDDLEEEQARQQFAAAENLLPCASDVVSSDLLWDLFFSAAILAFNASESDEAVRLFRAAALSNPAGTWDSNYSPQAQQLYVRGRELAAQAARVRMFVFDPKGLILEMHVDGQPGDPADPLLQLTADRHLIQFRTRYGQLLSLVAKVSGTEDVIAVTAEGILPLLMDGSGAGAELASMALLGPRLEAPADAPLQRAIVVDTDSSRVRYFDGQSAAFLGPALEFEGKRVAAPKKGPNTAEKRFGLVVGGGYLHYAMPNVLRKSQGNITGLVSLRLTHRLFVDAGLHLGMVRLKASDYSNLAQDSLGLTPVVRVGMRYEFLPKAVRPYAGGVFLLSLHHDKTIAAGGGAVVGAVFALGGPLYLRADLLAGYASGFVLSGTASLGFRL